MKALYLKDNEQEGDDKNPMSKWVEEGGGIQEHVKFFLKRYIVRIFANVIIYNSIIKV
jgi:hypothetical protein